MSTTTPQTWGARIRQRRLELGLTQVQVAEAAALSQRSLSAYESNDVLPPARRQTRIAAALDIAPEALFPFSDITEEVAS